MTDLLTQEVIERLRKGVGGAIGFRTVRIPTEDARTILAVLEAAMELKRADMSLEQGDSGAGIKELHAHYRLLALISVEETK